jgi:hypothetical protein
LAGAPIDMVRVAQSRNLTAQPQDVGQALTSWLGNDSHASPLVVRNPTGDGDVSIAPVRLGLHDEIGILVAGSRRADFPTETERLLLAVAANQAAIGLQEARLLSERRQVAEELDQRVTQRTRELAAVNEELREKLPSASGRKRSCGKTNRSCGGSPMRYPTRSSSSARTALLSTRTDSFSTTRTSRWTRPPA